MELITFPLRLNMKGERVTDLQNMLSRLGHEIEASEKTARQFGRTTQNAVRKFQEDLELEATGVVDEETAARINGRRKGRGCG